MDDLVSRQAAKDELCKMLHDCFWADDEELDAVAVTLDNLPPAQPEIPPYVAEIEAEYKKWINVPYIGKPLAKALYEVWKRHDREDTERRTDD